MIVATYGDPAWQRIAKRAIASAKKQSLTPREVIAVHGETLAMARNQGAEQASSSHLIFLDADDELDRHYVRSMDSAIRAGVDRIDRMYQPATLGVQNGVEDPEPVLIPSRPLREGNFLVIGTMVTRSAFLGVGGFDEWEAYEDWDLFIRLWEAGVKVIRVPSAIYRVHVNLSGRNSISGARARAVFSAIQRRHFGP